MKLIDLHVHSTASDGSFTPAEVTAPGREAGRTAIALTDHGTVSGVGEALAAAGDFPLEVVPGVELSCLYKEKEIHILGLYIDHTDKAFLDFLDQAEIKRNSRNQLMLAAFQKDGFPITMEDLVMGNPDTVVTRAHFARALVKKGASPLWTRPLKNTWIRTGLITENERSSRPQKPSRPSGTQEAFQSWPTPAFTGLAGCRPRSWCGA